MGLLDFLKSDQTSDNSQNENKFKQNWEALVNEEQLEVIKEASKTKLQVIFKHSTRCIISKRMLEQFDKECTLDTDKVQLYVLDLITYRPVSNKIAADFEVEHQSPQCLVIKDGKAISVRSSHEVSAKVLEEL